MNSDHISSLSGIILKLKANRQKAIDLCEATLLAMKNGNHYIEFGWQTLTVDGALQMLKALRREVF